MLSQQHLPAMLRSLFVVAAIAAMTTTTLAQSDTRDSHDQWDQRRDFQQNDRADQNDDAQAFAGTVEILRMKKVQVRNSDLEHAVALVRTDDGSRGVVDLGPARQLRDLELRQGRTVTVRGKQVVIGDRDILMATRVEARGRTVNVDRGEQPRMRTRRVVLRSDLEADTGRETSSQRGTSQTRNQARNDGRPRIDGRQRDLRQSRPGGVRGKVEQTKRVAVRDVGIDHLVAAVRTENDDLRLVDLGPVKNLNQVRFAVGDTIIADGDIVAVGDQQVLMARRVGAGGQQQEIRRDSRRDDRSQDNSRSDDR